MNHLLPPVMTITEKSHSTPKVDGENARPSTLRPDVLQSMHDICHGRIRRGRNGVFVVVVVLRVARLIFGCGEKIQNTPFPPSSAM